MQSQLYTGLESNPAHNKVAGCRIFSIKRPRCLFQTWPGGLGVYLRPAFNWGLEFINEVIFFYHSIELIYNHPTSEAQAKLFKMGGFFPLFNLTNFPWVFSKTQSPQHTACVLLYATIKMCKKKNMTYAQYWGKLIQSFKSISKHYNATQKVQQ